MKWITWIAVLAASLAAALGQNPADRPYFDVVSIKKSKINEGSDSETTPGYLRMQGTLKSIIRNAYGVKPDQVQGGPKWIDEDHYEIEARAASPANGQQLLDMLQTLLAEKFKLDFHRETKTVSGYALVRAKNGLKMKEVGPGPSHIRGGTGTMTGQSVSLSALANHFARMLGTPVADESDTSGYFDFALTWAPEKTNPAASDAPTDSGAPSIFTAIQEQLGLKLEPRKVTIEILAVDHVERPPLN